MKLTDIAVGKLKEELGKEHTIELLKKELLGIRLREQIYWAEDKEIKNDPVRRATSELLIAQGKKPFWLLVGGLMDSRLKLNKKVTGVGGQPGDIGFSSKGLLDYYSMHPYAIDFNETPEKILADHSIDLPVTAAKAQALLPGTTFQLMGKGVASLSGGLTYNKGLTSVALKKSEKCEGNFTLRLVREKGDTVKVVLAQTLERAGGTELTAKLGYSFDVGKILEHDAFKKAETNLDNLNLDKITGAIPGWPKNKTLTEFIKKEGIDKGIEKLKGYLKGYSEFYSTLGHKSSQKQRNLVAYRFDLSKAKAKTAFNEIVKLNEAEVETAEAIKNSGVTRHQFKDETTVDEGFFHLGFPGKKLVLASTLRSEREGFLIYDGSQQIMRDVKIAKTYEGVITGTKKITWEALDIILNSEKSPLSYWRFSFSNNDKFAEKEEIIRFRKFAACLGAQTPDDDAKIRNMSFFKKLFGKKDDTTLNLDMYFTADGLNTISSSIKNQIRKACFEVAAKIGDIAEGAPWGNFEARSLMKQCSEYLFDLTGGSDQDIKFLEGKYSKLPAAKGRVLKKDAIIYKICSGLIAHIYQMKVEESNQETWARVFGDIGKSARFNYMIIIATLASLAGREETLLDNLELKRTESGEVLAMADEKSEIITADELFTKAEEQITQAIG